MSDDRPSKQITDTKGRPVDFMTEFGLYCGTHKQFPNRTILTTPSQHLSYNVKKSLDQVAENHASKIAGCWGKKK